MKSETNPKIRVHLTARVHPLARKAILAYGKTEKVVGAGQAIDRMTEKFLGVTLPPLNPPKPAAVKKVVKPAAKPVKKEKVTTLKSPAKKPAPIKKIVAPAPAKKVTPFVLPARTPAVHGGPLTRPVDRQPILRPSEAKKAKV